MARAGICGKRTQSGGPCRNPPGCTLPHPSEVAGESGRAEARAALLAETSPQRSSTDHSSSSMPGGDASEIEWEYSLIGDAYSATVDGTEYTVTAGVGFDTRWRAYADGLLLGSYGARDRAMETAATHAQSKRGTDPAQRERHIAYLRGVIRSYESHEPFKSEPPRSYEEAKEARAELRDTYGLSS